MANSTVKLTSEEVIVFTAAGQVVTFNSLLRAKATLFREHHDKIIIDKYDLAKRYSLNQIKQMLGTTIKINPKDFRVQCMRKSLNKAEIVDFIWPMLVEHGKSTVNKAFGITPKPKYRTHTYYYSDYAPGIDPQRDRNYSELALQAKVLVDLIVEHITPRGKEGLPWYTLIKLIKQWHDDGKLVTKQDPLFIFTYYKKQLLMRRFIEESQRTT